MTIRDAAPDACRAEPGPDRVSWSGGAVVLRDAGLLGPGADAPARRFLGRAFRLAEVASVSVDRARAMAVVRPATPPADPGAFLARLAAALRDGAGPTPALPHGVREGSFTVYRHGPLLSTCRVLADEPGRLRIRHDSLRGDAVLSRRFGTLMGSLPGVTRTALDPRTGSLTLRYDAGALSAPRLIRLAEEALDSAGWWDRAVPPPPRTSFALANTNLVAGAAADLAVSALAPVSALLLVGTNLKTFRLAWWQVRRRRPGLPVLYTVIVGGTLAGGQFLASALMSWSFKYWHDRLRHDLTAERRRLLDECLPVPRLARLDVPAGEVLGPSDRLRAGDRVLVGPGERVPADGRVTRGDGVVDEQALRGRPGATRVRPGDAVLAGAAVLHGTLCVEVTCAADRTRASHLGRALLEATSPAPGLAAPTRRSEAFAERAVVPTIAAAGVGLLAGDLATASAMLRPDYATGPGVSAPLGAVRDAAACARRGIVVRTPDALERLARVDEVIVDDAPALHACGLEVAEIRSPLPEALLLRHAASAYRHLADERAEALLDACRDRRCHVLDLPAEGFDAGVTVLHGGRRVRVRERSPGDGPAGPLVVEVDGQAAGLIGFGRSERPRAAAAVARLREIPGVSPVLVSHRTEGEAAALAARLGIPRFRAGLSDEGKAAFLRERRAAGARAAFFGDGRNRPGPAAAADVTVSTSGAIDAGADASAVVLLRPDLDRLADLLGVARDHARELQADQRLVLLPNALCVAGALFFGVTALAVVVVNNLSTFGLYRRATGSLHGPAAAGRPRRPLQPAEGPAATP